MRFLGIDAIGRQKEAINKHPSFPESCPGAAEY
jgi:hypothetical protein